VEITPKDLGYPTALSKYNGLPRAIACEQFGDDLLGWLSFVLDNIETFSEERRNALLAELERLGIEVDICETPDGRYNLAVVKRELRKK
jgi:hypothetical protein